MKWLKKLFGLPNNSQEVKLTPEQLETQEEIQKWGRPLTGDEDECEHCHKPIFRDTEKWTKLQGHYFHRKCWKEGVKNQ